MLLHGMVLATTEQMLEIGMASVLAERPLRGDVALSPDGKHVLTALVLLDHRGGEACDPFLRCRAALSVVGEPEPVWQDHLDVDLVLYADLTPAPGVEDQPGNTMTFDMPIGEEEL